MPARTFSGTGLRVDGLTESVKALGKISKEVRKEATDSMRDGAKLIQKKAQGSIGNHPGYGMPTSKSMISRSVTAKGAAIKLRRVKFPWAGGGEFGAVFARVHGPWRLEAKFKRSLYAPHKPPTNRDLFKSRGGYWIQPAIRKNIKQVNRIIDRDMSRLLVKNLRPDQIRKVV